MRLILARHGETDYNIKRLCPTDDGPTLTAKGKKQAAILADYASGKGIDAIFCSPSRRTQETLEPVIKRVHAPFFLEPLIRERSSGVWEGKPLDDAMKYREARGLEKWEFKPEGGESYADVSERARLFLEKMNKKYAGQTVLIISHSAFNNILAARIMGLSLDKAAFGLQDNCSVHELLIEKGKATTVKINHRHLLDSAQED